MFVDVSKLAKRAVKSVSGRKLIHLTKFSVLNLVKSKSIKISSLPSLMKYYKDILARFLLMARQELERHTPWRVSGPLGMSSRGNQIPNPGSFLEQWVIFSTCSTQVVLLNLQFMSRWSKFTTNKFLIFYRHQVVSKNSKCMLVVGVNKIKQKTPLKPKT